MTIADLCLTHIHTYIVPHHILPTIHQLYAHCKRRVLRCYIYFDEVYVEGTSKNSIVLSHLCQDFNRTNNVSRFEFSNLYVILRDRYHSYLTNENLQYSLKYDHL